MGIGPTQSAWKAEILPLNYTRTDSDNDKHKRDAFIVGGYTESISMLENITISDE